MFLYAIMDVIKIIPKGHPVTHTLRADLQLRCKIKY